MSAIQMTCSKCGQKYMAGVVGTTPWPPHECPVPMPDDRPESPEMRPRTWCDACGREHGVETCPSRGRPESSSSVSPEERLRKEADNLRFQLGRVLRGAKVLGDSMDAPVKLADLQAVELTSMRHFLRSYDEAALALSTPAGPGTERTFTEADVRGTCQAIFEAIEGQHVESKEDMREFLDGYLRLPFVHADLTVERAPSSREEAGRDCDSCGGDGLTYSPDHEAHFCPRCFARANPSREEETRIGRYRIVRNDDPEPSDRPDPDGCSWEVFEGDVIDSDWFTFPDAVARVAELLAPAP